MENQPGASEWFAFRVRPRHEKQVSLSLRDKGYEEFLPLVKSRRQWADRIKVVEMPLFPGYIFCASERAAIVPILTTSGVIDVVRAGQTPLAADPAEVEALRQTVKASVTVEPWPYTASDENTRFTILRGPLAGLTGVLVEVRQSHRLILSVNLLRRSVLVEMHPEWVMPDAPAYAQRLTA